MDKRLGSSRKIVGVALGHRLNPSFVGRLKREDNLVSTLTENNPSLPAWFTVADAAKYSGLSGALLYELINEECIVSSTVLRPGRRRGRRLIQRTSLDAFIEKGIGKSSIDNVRGGAARENSNGKKGGFAE